jgi:hypothetical protein
MDLSLLSSTTENLKYMNIYRNTNDLEEKKESKSNMNVDNLGLDEDNNLEKNFTIIIDNKEKVEINKNLITKNSKLIRIALENDLEIAELEINLYDKLVIKNENNIFYFNKIIDYITYYNNHDKYEIEKPVKYTLKEANVPEWDENYLIMDENHIINMKHIFNMYAITSYLEIEQLCSLLAAFISVQFKYKSEVELEQYMQNIFN